LLPPKPSPVSPNPQLQSPQSNGPNSPENGAPWPRPTSTPKIDLSKIQNPLLAGNTPLVSPALMSPALASPHGQPSPMKKKLTLSDWTNRNKKKAQDAAAASIPSTSKTIPEEPMDGAEKENHPDRTSQMDSQASQAPSSDPMQIDPSPTVTVDVDKPPSQPDS